MRSIPEKTLEHWASIYLSNRFPNGALWWPASGEDVLVELPQMAGTGVGKTLALELKTTEATSAGHELQIDTVQLDRYLNPPSGPPLPVYYVFPVPHWAGPLTSRSGSSPVAPPAHAASPPEWWRQRVGPQWFGEWLYVMSAQSLSASLPYDWKARSTAKLFELKTTCYFGGAPPWRNMFNRPPAVAPLGWQDFWRSVVNGGPPDGILWRTIARGSRTPDYVQVLGSDEQRLWHLGELFDQPWLNHAGQYQLVPGETTIDEDGNERVLLHIP